MLEKYSTNAVAAKIRAVCGTMLTMDDFREMVSKRSVAEVADCLAHTARYGERLRDIDPNTVHRGLLEQLLNDQNYALYRRLVSFSGLEDRPFYDFLLKRYECRQMINLVNAVSCGLQLSFVQSLPSFLISDSKIDFLALARCQTIDELTAAMKGSRFYKLFAGFARTPEGKADLPDAELKLRTRLYEQLLQDVKKSGFGSDSNELNRLILSEIDVINIINAYRLKAFFGYTPDEIRKAMLPFTQMGRAAMNRFYDCPDADRMRSVIAGSVYGRYMSDGDEDVEPPLRKRILTNMKHTLARSCAAPVSLYAFMYVCENELRNIVRVIEGVRYDVDPAMIFSLLIF